jgi:hypothetical protein
MLDSLLDVNLLQMPDAYLTGNWRVASRVLNQTDPDSALAQANRMVLSEGQVQVQTNEPYQNATGSWAVLRDELLSRPYLALNLLADDTRALITRLRRSPDGERSLLDLYFASGMEMKLECP